MECSKESFVFRLLQELSRCKYFYKETAYGCIKAMRDQAGLKCDSSDDEIYEALRITWNNAEFRK